MSALEFHKSTWAALEGPTSTVPDVKYPRRAVKQWTAAPADRILTWCGRTTVPVLFSDLLQTLAPSLAVSLVVGTNRTTRLCGLNGCCLVPAGAAVEIALDSPRYGISPSAVAARYFRFCAGSVDLHLGEAMGGSFADRVSLEVPVVADNATGTEYSITAVSFEQVSGYSSYMLKACAEAPLFMLEQANAAPWQGSVAQSNQSQQQTANTMANDLLAGYAVKVWSATGFPVESNPSNTYYFGSANVYRAGTLSFR